MSSLEKEISIAGFTFKLTSKLMVMIVSIAPVVGGAFWGVFEFYNDYMSMRRAITSYVSPDFTEYDKKIALLIDNTDKVNEYTRDIKNDLKADIRRLDKTVSDVERDTRQLHKEMKTDMKALEKETEYKIKKALKNPFAEE